MLRLASSSEGLAVVLDTLLAVADALIRWAEAAGLPGWSVWALPVAAVAYGARFAARQRGGGKSSEGGEVRDVMATCTPSTTYDPKPTDCDQFIARLTATRQPFRVLIDNYDGPEANDAGSLRHRVWTDIRTAESLRTLTTKYIRVEIDDSVTVAGEPAATDMDPG